jgi:hypothetical protein
MEEASKALFALKPVTFRYKNDPTIAQRHKDFETAITKLRKEVETVVAHLQEQDGRSGMSAQVEMSKPAPQMVATN